MADKSIDKFDPSDISSCIELLRRWQFFSSWSLRGWAKGYDRSPDIADFVDSVISLAEDESLSLARIGDGEFGLATGVTSPNNGCQHFDDSLKTALTNVLACDKATCHVAIPKAFFYKDPSVVSPGTDSFADDIFAKQFSDGGYMDYIRPGYRYLDASLSIVKAHYSTLSPKVYSAYYSIFRKILHGRDLIVVTGDLRCLEYERNLLSDAGAGSTTIILTPRRNAWDSYAAMKDRLLSINGDGSRLVILGCGPTATVLAYELSDTMRCLDLGHVFADYNLAMGGSALGNFWS